MSVLGRFSTAAGLAGFAAGAITGSVVFLTGIRCPSCGAINLERSFRFYQSVFGMEERFRDGPKMVCGRPAAECRNVGRRENPCDNGDFELYCLASERLGESLAALADPGKG